MGEVWILLNAPLLRCTSDSHKCYAFKRRAGFLAVTDERTPIHECGWVYPHVLKLAHCLFIVDAHAKNAVHRIKVPWCGAQATQPDLATSTVALQPRWVGQYVRDCCIIAMERKHPWCEPTVACQWAGYCQQGKCD